MNKQYPKEDYASQPPLTRVIARHSSHPAPRSSYREDIPPRLYMAAGSIFEANTSSLSHLSLVVKGTVGFTADSLLANSDTDRGGA